MTTRSATNGDTHNIEGFRMTAPELLAFLRRYATVILSVFVLTVLSAYAALSLMSEQYEARSALLVKLGRENLDPPPTARNAVFSTGLRREEVLSEIEILAAPALIGETVDAIGPDAFKPVRVVPPGFFPKVKYYTKAVLRGAKAQFQEFLIAADLKKRLSDREGAILGIQNALTVQPEKESDVIALRLRMPDPALAVRVQQTLIGLYLQRRIEVRQSRGVKEFLDQRTSEVRETLATAEDATNAWKRSMHLVSPAEQKALLLKQIRDMAADHNRVLSDRETLRRQMNAAHDLIALAPERVNASQMETPNASRQTFRDRLAKLEADRARVTSTYQPQASTVRTLDEEITNLRLLVDLQPSTEVGAVTSALNPLRQQLEATLQDVRVRFEGLTASAALQRQQLAGLEAELRQLEEGDARLSDLERERRIAEQNYISTANRRDEAAIATQLDLSRISNVSVATPPTATLQPVYPPKLLIMAVALGVGLFLGLATALLLEWMAEDLRDSEQIEQLATIPCLGVITFPTRTKDVA